MKQQVSLTKSTFETCHANLTNANELQTMITTLDSKLEAKETVKLYKLLKIKQEKEKKLDTVNEKFIKIQKQVILYYVISLKY